MSVPQPTLSRLHYTLLRHIVDHGFAPDTAALAELLATSEPEVVAGLAALAENHGVVLHPNSSKVWVVHPFALAPTLFWIRAGDRSWWGNCAWCSLGVAALIGGDVTITTTLGARDVQVEIPIRDGQIEHEQLLVHFPIPMQKAWDNVLYTCSLMLVFETEDAIDAWCRQHAVAKGDVQPIRKIWQMAQVWYGDHLNPEWRKWTTQEAREIFRRFDLNGPIWDLPDSESRF